MHHAGVVKVPSRGEECPELCETDPERLGWIYEDATPLMRAALDTLVASAPEPLTFEEIELSLGWHRGRFASVFGGFRAARGKYCLRPFRLRGPRASVSGEWEAWVDEEMAPPLRAAAARERA
jgi:hypothetical protein